MSTKTLGIKSNLEKVHDPILMDQLRKEYHKNRNIKEIAIREGINSATLYYHFRKKEPNLSKRFHSLKENYFEKIDSDAKAYILGFIVADGCVTKTSPGNLNANRLQFNISTKDKSILEFIKTELNCDYKIRDYIPPKSTYGTESMSVLAINSSRICKDLSNLGVCEQKTGKEKIPKLSNKLFWSFLRGFFDGDGSVYFANTLSGIYKRISFSSASKDMLEHILARIYKILKEPMKMNIHPEGKRPDGTTKKAWCIYINTQAIIKKIANNMYKNASFSLQRKRIKLT